MASTRYGGDVDRDAEYEADDEASQEATREAIPPTGLKAERDAMFDVTPDVTPDAGLTASRPASSTGAVEMSGSTPVTAYAEPASTACEGGTWEMVALVDRDYRYLYACPSAGSLFGQDAAAWVGQHVFDLIHPDDQPIVDQFTSADVLHRSGRDGLVYRMVFPTGQTVWMQTTVRMLDEKGPRFSGERVLVHRIFFDSTAAHAPGDIAYRWSRIGLEDWNTFDPVLDHDWARLLIDASGMPSLMRDLEHFALLLSHDDPIQNTGLSAKALPTA